MRLLAIAILTAALGSAQPRRIISTTPSITEILFALGLGDRVVGVTTYCRFPAEAQKLAKIGTFLDPHLETILSLKPDLVIVQKNPVRLTERLRAMKLNVLEVNPESMEGVDSTVRQIAEACSVSRKGNDIVKTIRDELARLQEKARRLPPVKVAFVVGRTPGTIDGIFVAAKDSYLAELLKAAGGNNVFSDAAMAYPKITQEDLIARNPDVIIDMGDNSHQGFITAEHRKSVLKLWQRYATLTAVRKGRIYPVADDRFVVPGPRMLDAIREFGRMLHPEASW